MPGADFAFEAQHPRPGGLRGLLLQAVLGMPLSVALLAVAAAYMPPPAATLAPPLPAPALSPMQLLAAPQAHRGEAHWLESWTDQVRVGCTDSVMDMLRQHHSFPGGSLLPHLGFHWEAISPVKRKWVGQLCKPAEVYDGPGDEYDLNLDMVPHLAGHVTLLLEGLEAARASGRNMAHCVLAPAQGAPQALLRNARQAYAMGCELTLPAPAQKHLDGFWPTVAEGQGVPMPCLGVYGPWVKDCNHNCRPEIHPIQWMWWLRGDQRDPNAWNLLLTGDGSGRFDDWVGTSQAGEIMLPVLLNAESGATAVLELWPHYWDGKECGWTSHEQWVALPDGGKLPLNLRYPALPDAALQAEVLGVVASVGGNVMAMLRVRVQAGVAFAGELRVS